MGGVFEMKPRLPMAMVVLALFFGLTGVSCSETSPTRELANDPADVTIPGVPPTAPPTTKYDGRGLSPDAMVLIGQLNELQSETELCALLTGNVLKPLLSGEIDMTSLVTSPSGVSQLLVAVDSLFAHMVEISPPEVQPATATIRDIWKRVAEIPADATDRDARTAAIMAEPSSEAAKSILESWLTKNCGTGSVISGLGLG